MKTNLELYEEYRGMLVNQHKETILMISSVSDNDISEDDGMRKFVTELMETASYINTNINLVDSKIKRLKRKLEEA